MFLKRLRARLSSTPARRGVSLGDLRRITPISKNFGYDRGGPIDRYYIERFLAEKQSNVQGSVLEIKDNSYTVKFGKNKVVKSDVVDINPNNKNANIISDLAIADNINDNSYDCVILTQVLQFIYNYDDAIKNIHRILRPNGTLLLTVPGITSIAYAQLGSTWYWSFSEASIKRILSNHFMPDRISVEKYGNVLTATAFLYGLGMDELTIEEYESRDPDYQVIIAAIARK